MQCLWNWSNFSWSSKANLWFLKRLVSSSNFRQILIHFDTSSFFNHILEPKLTIYSIRWNLIMRSVNNYKGSYQLVNGTSNTACITKFQLLVHQPKATTTYGNQIEARRIQLLILLKQNIVGLAIKSNLKIKLT